MSIQINNNFDYKGNQPNFERDRFETLELMCSADERSLDNGHISYCEETGKHYVFNENNDIDVETGKWRLLIENPENLDTNKQDKTDNALDTTDKTVVGAINEINGNTLDNVTFSADYKNIIINRKNGLNPYTIPIASIINNAKIIELNDVDSTDIGNGKTLVYDGATQKHKYVDSIGTDELVKMDSTTDAKYLSDLIDKSTVVNDNGVLKVKKLDGQEVTIAEINHLKGLTMNVMDLVNAFANGGVKVYERTIPTYADLLALDRSGFIDGIKYFVYVQSDETHDGAKTTYICDKNSTSYFCVSGDHRDFTTNPIDLVNEVTGKLGTGNIDIDALWKLLTINDTYKTLTTKNEVFGTHGAKALYDELVADIGKKANSSDLTSHTSDTNIHVTTSDKTKWNKVDNKIDKTDITTTIDSTSTDTEVPSAKTIYNSYVDACQKGLYSWKVTNITDTWVRVLRLEHVVRCASGIFTFSLHTAECCNVGSFLVSKNFNKVSVKQLNFGGFNGGFTLKIRALSQRTSDELLVELYTSISNASDIRCTFIPLTSGKVTTLNEAGAIPTDYNVAEWKCIQDKNDLVDANRICTTSVADVVKTSITSNNTDLYTIGQAHYCVKNGICYINFWPITVKKTGSSIKTGKIFPHPLLVRASGALIDGNGNFGGQAYIGENGELRFDCALANTELYCTISYPVENS